MTILDGKNTAKAIYGELNDTIVKLKKQHKRVPKLAIVLVGDNAASKIYVANKIKACQAVGINVKLIKQDKKITERKLLSIIDNLNADKTIDGFIVQLPLPPHIDESRILQAIDWRKDVDGLTPSNVGRVEQGLPAIVSATPRGITELMRRYNIKTTGKHVVVIGRSNIVGKPMAMLLMQRPYLSLPGMSASAIGNATVTICHSETKNLAAICKTADIIIVAAGSPGLLKANMVKDNVIVIDVGINRVIDTNSPKGYKIVGDVDYEKVRQKSSYITPVPGGVGPMTVASLLQNTMQAYKMASKNKKRK